MIFYASGTYSTATTYMPLIDYLAASRTALLTSFAYPEVLKTRSKWIADRLRPEGGRVLHMLDSGAFSLWAKGEGEISIDDLCDTANRLLDEYSDCFDWVFVSLDVIPGKKGQEITPADIAEACQGSARNYEIMRKRVRGYVKPVFHVGDPDWLMDLYADAPYIGLGFSQSISEQARIQWARRNTRKFAGRQLHGLAATGWKMLTCAPWHSVDSAAWMYSASMGGISMQRENGSLYTLAISDISPKRRDFDQHLENLSPAHRGAVLAQIEAEGTTLEGLQKQGALRLVWNAKMYKRACDAAERYWHAQTLRQGELFAAT